MNTSNSKYDRFFKCWYELTWYLYSNLMNFLRQLSVTHEHTHTHTYTHKHTHSAGPFSYRCCVIY